MLFQSVNFECVEVVMKKKREDRFPICRRGYDKVAVDNFVALEQAKAEELQTQLRECINSLKNENDNLKSELIVFKSREEQIKLALVNASSSAKRLEDDVKKRYENELERLRLFRAKWINAYEQLKERYHFDKDALNVESVAVSCELELKKMLSKDFALDKAPIENEMEEHFCKEVERLTSMQIAHQSKHGDEMSVGAKDDSCEVMSQRILQGEIGREDAMTYPADEECDFEVKTHEDEDTQILKRKLEEIKSKRRKTSTETVAFSLDEAMSPTSTLEQNCQAISLAKK